MFVQKSLCTGNINFHDKLEKVKLLNFRNNSQTKMQPKQSNNLKLARADRNLFLKELVARYAGREISFKDLLEHELSPVPLSIANTAGELGVLTRQFLVRFWDKESHVQHYLQAPF